MSSAIPPGFQLLIGGQAYQFDGMEVGIGSAPATGGNALQIPALFSAAWVAISFPFRATSGLVWWSDRKFYFKRIIWSRMKKLSDRFSVFNRSRSFG